MAKPRGHRANKPNDNKGTIDNDNLYRGKYRDEVYQDDDEIEVLEDPSQEEATPQDTEEVGTSFVAKRSESEEKAEDTADYKKRYDDLKRHYDSKLDEWKQEREELANARQAGQESGLSNAELPKTPQELEEFKQKYPEVYSVVETISTLQAEARLKDLKSEVETLKGREKELQVQAAYKELLSQHPDFPQLKTDEKFLMWLDQQPSSIGDGIYKNNSDVKWASRVLDLYKADMGIGKKTRKARDADAAAAVTQSTAKEVVDKNSDKKIWKASEIGKLKSWQFEKLEAEIDAAKAEGRIDYKA